MNAERCYFAHHVTDYGTEREDQAIEAIVAHGFLVENPNSPENEAAYHERGMAHFIEIVKECHSLAFQRFPNGAIGAGVAKEIGAASADDKPIFEVKDDTLERVDVQDITDSFLTVDATRALIKAIRNARA